MARDKQIAEMRKLAGNLTVSDIGCQLGEQTAPHSLDALNQLHAILNARARFFKHHDDPWPRTMLSMYLLILLFALLAK